MARDAAECQGGLAINDRAKIKKTVKSEPKESSASSFLKKALGLISDAAKTTNDVVRAVTEARKFYKTVRGNGKRKIRK